MALRSNETSSPEVTTNSMDGMEIKRSAPPVPIQSGQTDGKGSSSDSGESAEFGGSGDASFILASSNTGGGNQNKSANDQEVVPTHDPPAVARQIREIIEQIRSNQPVARYTLNTTMVNRTAMSRGLILDAYQRLYNANLRDDAYEALRNRHFYTGDLFAFFTWIYRDGQVVSSEPETRRDGHSWRQRSEGAILPGWDPLTGSNFLYFDIPEKYAVVGQEVRAVHTDDRETIEPNPRLPRMETAVLRTPSDERRRLVVTAQGRQQTFSFRAEEEGRYRVMAFIRHPDGHIETLDQTVEVKQAAAVNTEAYNESVGTTASQGFTAFRGGLELAEMDMERRNSRQLEEMRRYQAMVDEQTDTMDPATIMPVGGVFTDSERGSNLRLSMFIGRAKDPSQGIVLVDLTPGSGRRPYTGSNTAEVIQKFDADNTYPNGVIRFQNPTARHGIDDFNVTLQTDGRSFLQSISEGFGWASLGFAAAGLIASVVPGGQVAAPWLFMAAAGAGTVASGASLADRFRAAEISATGVTLDILGIASSIVGGAAAFRAMQAGGRVLSLSSGGRFLIYSDVAINGASGLVMSVEGVTQIEAVLNSNEPHGEQIGKIVRILSGMALNAGLFALSVKDAQAARNQLSQRLGAGAVDNLDGQTILMLNMLDEDQLAALARVPRSELQAYSQVVGQNWPKASQLLEIGAFANFQAFRRAFDTMSDLTVSRFQQVFSEDYLARLGDGMRTRYDRLRSELLAGTLSGQDINTRLQVLDEVSDLRTAMGNAATATSRTQSRKLSIGQRNIAYGSYDIKLPDGRRIQGELVGVSGEDTTERLNNLAANQSAIPTALAGRTLANDIDDANRTFAITIDTQRNDSEAKMMEHIAKQLEAQSGYRLSVPNTYSGFEGTITIYTEMSPCNSCGNILSLQASALFQGRVNVNVNYGVNYP